MHHIDSAAQGPLLQSSRFLGAVPELPEGLSDAEQAAAAAHCVHQVRAMLQIRQRVTGHKTFAITSPAPGEGKTSLTISLGMALAASGCETLLIDCDFEGWGLSSRMAQGSDRSRQPLGQMLLDQHLIGEAKLQEGLELAKSKSLKLGEALVQLGFVDPATIEERLREQRTCTPGLGDVLRGTAVERAIRSTGRPSLSILPLGSTSGNELERPSPATLKALLDRVSPNFGVVLVDCGPALGSVEASVVAAAVDGVILLVSRGSDRSMAQQAAHRLMAAEAHIEGIVFNRADFDDLSTTVYGSSSHPRSTRSSRSEPVNKSVN